MAAEKHSVDSWGARLNATGEQLTLEEVTVLILGHQNTYLEIMMASLQDMQMRMHRLELFVQAAMPGYDEHVRAWLEREESERQKREREQYNRPVLKEAQNGAV